MSEVPLYEQETEDLQGNVRDGPGRFETNRPALKSSKLT